MGVVILAEVGVLIWMDWKIFGVKGEDGKFDDGGSNVC